MNNINSNYSKLEKTILNIAKNDYTFFLNKLNVVAIGLGYKIKNGFYTKEKSIKIFVIKKVPRCCLNTKDIIPKIYKGIKTDVISSGPFYISSLTARVRPTIGGYSVGNAINELEAGSIGCLVGDKKNLYILSNNHVLANGNTVPLNTPILQPAISDGGSLPKAFIGNLSKFVPLKFKDETYTPVNYVDCAIAKVSTPSIASSKIAFIGNPTGVNTPVLNEVVEKAGRTTDYTIGKVTHIGVTALVGTPRGELLYKDQIATSKISSQGDSGCVLLNVKKEVIGLQSCISDTNALFNSIYRVLSELKVNIVTNHN